MADSVYPGALDSDIQIQRVDDNITEIGGDAINGLRSAVFNIEEALGLNPQGTAADLAARLNVSINPDGSLKAAALAAVGLVTLPITNSQIASNAGIEESKLDLDFSTVTLRTLIANLEAFANAINNNLLQDISNLNQHIAHPSAYGRHQTSDIDGYVGKYASYNLQGIINEIDTILDDHIGTTKIGAHSGENVSVDDTFLNIDADNVQTAIAELDSLQDTLMIRHRDEFHSNGILRAQEVTIEGESHAGIRVASTSISSISAGSNSVSYPSPPSELVNVIRGDILAVTVGSQIFRFFVDRVDTTGGVVEFFGTFPITTTTATAAIYAKSSETAAVSNMILAKKNANTIQMVHPGAPFVLSHRADPRKINATVNRIRIRWHDGETDDINLYDVLRTYVSTRPSNWTISNLVAALNIIFNEYTTPISRDPWPLVAFEYKGEFGIAYDEAIEGAYVEVVTPNVSANSASNVLGLIEGTINFGFGPRKVYVDGYQISAVAKKIESTGDLSGNSITDLPAGINLYEHGVRVGDLFRIKGTLSNTSSGNNGSFIADTVTSSNATFNSPFSPGFAPEDSVPFTVWADTFTLDPAPSTPTLYELFSDGYNNQELRLSGSVRLTFTKSTSSAEDIEEVFEIVDVSRSFGRSSRRVYYDNTAKTLTLGQAGTGNSLSSGTEGESYALPQSGNVRGLRFKLYDNNNIDYIELQVVKNDYLTYIVPPNPSAIEDLAIDVEIYDRISEDKFLQLGAVLHNTSEFRFLSDRRLFGNVGRSDIRDDFTRDYISYPASQLRSNGVLYGMEVRERNDDNIDAYGGEVFVDGSVVVIPTREIAIPQDGVDFTYNLFVNGGRLHLLRDDFTESLINGSLVMTPSLAEILASKDKLLIAQIDVNASNQIQTIRDYRRFVNNLDDKMELIVEENTMTNGAFPTMRGALNWIAAMDSAGIPTSRVIKVRGVVDVDASETTSIPDGVSITGDTQTTDETVVRPTLNIVGVGAGSDFFSVGDGVTFENLLFTCGPSANVTTGIFGGSDIYNLTIKSCHFSNVQSISTLAIIYASSGSIENCTVEDCYIDASSSTFNNIFVMRANGSMADCRITNCSINSNVPGDAELFYASGSISNVCAKNVAMNNSGTGILLLAESSSSDISNGIFERCILEYGNFTISSSKTVISASNISDLKLESCQFNNLQTVSVESFYFVSCSSTLQRCMMLNCKVNMDVAEYVYLFNSFSGTATDIKIDNLHFANTNANLRQITAVGAGSDVSEVAITNSHLDYGPGGSVRSYVVRATSGDVSDLYINNCNIILGDYHAYAVEGDNLNRIVISDSSFSCGSIVFTGQVIYASSTLSNCFIKGNYFYQVRDAIFSPVGSDLFIMNNKVEGADETFVDVTVISDSVVSGNIVKFAAISSTILMNALTSAENTIVSGNQVENGLSCIQVGSATKLVVKENVASTMGERFLNVTGISTDVVVEGNVVEKTYTNNHCIDFQSAAERTSVVGNLLISNAMTSGTNSAMVNFDNGSNTAIASNVIKNINGGTGVAYAIQASGVNTSIASNSVDNFARSDLYSVRIEGSYVSVTGNSIDNSAYALSVLDCQDFTISGNTMVSSLGQRCLRIHSQSGEETVRGVISGNLIKSTASTNSSELVYITEDAGGTTSRLIISNNIFSQAHSSTSSEQIFNAELDVSYVYLHSNMFISELSQSYSVQPISALNSTNIISYNDVRGMIWLSSGDVIGNGSAIDYMNWGQEYDVIIPVAYAREARDGATGVSTWSSASEFRATNSSYSAGDAYISWSFGKDFVPMGATINYLEVQYSVVTGTAADLTIGWFKDSGLPQSSSTIVSSAAVSSTGVNQVETITPGTTVIMSDTDTHRLLIAATDASNPGSWFLIIYALNVNYTL